MRIILYNPHIDDFFYNPLIYKILGRRPLRKYGVVIDEIENHYIYIDYTESSIIPFKYFYFFPKLLRKVFLLFEIFFWKRINNKIKFIDKIKKDDVLLVMSYKTAHNMPKERLINFEKFSKVIVHLSHYFVNTSHKSQNLKLINNVILAGDSDITENAYFQNFFPWYNKEFLILSFALSTKWFSNLMVKMSDKKRLIATGTIHNLLLEKPENYYKSYISFSGLNNYHPNRVIANEICTKYGESSFVNFYRPSSSTKLSQFINQFKVKQSNYFKVDLVKEYSSHKFAIVGEEFSGFPALGAFEAMACGAILLADGSKYKGLGMIDGFNYIDTNNNLEDTVKEVFCFSDDKCQQISKNAKDFVHSNFKAIVKSSHWKAIINKYLND